MQSRAERRNSKKTGEYNNKEFSFIELIDVIILLPFVYLKEFVKARIGDEDLLFTVGAFVLASSFGAIIKFNGCLPDTIPFFVRLTSVFALFNSFLFGYSATVFYRIIYLSLLQKSYFHWLEAKTTLMALKCMTFHFKVNDMVNSARRAFTS